MEPAPAPDVDLLLVVDNSGTLSEENASLAMQLPRLISALGSGDLDGDGAPDFTPVRSLHAGVVTTDMGTGGFTVPTCSPADYGDDGILRTEGDSSRTECSAAYPPFLTYVPGTGDGEELVTDLGCVALRSVDNGCGWEQPLEAALKVLTPSTSDVSFFRGTSGHGDGDNAGFLRADSILAILVFTDEDDCSVLDPEIFDPAGGPYEGNLNLRCFRYPMAVQPTSRYVDGLLALRRDPEDLVYAAVVGIPPSSFDDGAPSYDQILAAPGMQEMIDPADPNRLTPSCNEPGRGLAFPPRRLVTVARDLDARSAHTAAHTLCRADLAPAMDAVLAAISAAIDEPRYR